MFIHIGDNKSVPENEIIGVFDLDRTSAISREFLKSAEAGGLVVELCSDIPKSFVLCGGRSVQQVYLSTVAAETIRKRAKRLDKPAGFR